jgi:hypothetical protein
MTYTCNQAFAVDGFPVSVRLAGFQIAGFATDGTGGFQYRCASHRLFLAKTGSDTEILAERSGIASRAECVAQVSIQPARPRLDGTLCTCNCERAASVRADVERKVGVPLEEAVKIWVPRWKRQW